MADKIGLGPDDRLLVAGSTHPGEEEAVIASFKELSGDFPELKLLIAPRHVDRVPEIENVVRQYHLTPVRVSSIDEHDATQYAIRNTLNHSLRSGSGRAHDPEPLAASRLGRCPAPNGAGFRASAGRVYLLDTIGSLTAAYSLASVVVIGGSFVMHGGQNPIEPAALGKPVIFGPYMFNFKEPSRLLVEGRAAIQISYPRYITGEVRRLLKNAAAAVALGDNARRVVAANRGATERDIGIIGDALGNGAKG
jgi:3-deoxy-D-manno-octulosonic-acid transferase